MPSYVTSANVRCNSLGGRVCLDGLHDDDFQEVNRDNLGLGAASNRVSLLNRNLRHRSSAVPPLPCDKLFVPPNMVSALSHKCRNSASTVDTSTAFLQSDAINRAVHAVSVVGNA